MKTDGARPRSSKEKARGWVWMFGSLIGAIVVLSGFGYIARGFGTTMDYGIMVGGLLAWDALIFRWGVRRFSITPPRYFREAMQDD